MPGHLRHTLPKNLGIFKQHEPIVLGNFDDGLAWTEGPLWLDGRLIFSDPVEGSIWGVTQTSNEPALRRLRENAGGCQGPTSALSDRVVLNRHEESLRLKHVYCPNDQLEPGPNGHAVENSTNGYPTGLLVEAQHGARRVIRRDRSSLEIIDVLASSYGGLPLNCPNDIAIHPIDHSIHFTDPYYCFLEKGARAALGDQTNYTQEKSALGFAGVYRVRSPERVGAADMARPELLTTEISRPNGIQFEPKPMGEEAHADDALSPQQHAMWVSECCQGHAASCPKATARWHRYVPVGNNYTRVRTIEWARPGGGGGCADGFKFLPRPGRPSLLVGSCPLGVCVVDPSRPDEDALVEYVDFGGFVVSNVAFGGDDLDHLYVTGSGHVWKLPLSELAKEPPEPTPNEEHWSRAYKEEV